MDISVGIMEANGVTVDQFRAVDHELAPGVYPVIREHGAAADDSAGAVRACRGGRHPCAGLADLARREVVGLHARDRAALGNSSQLNGTAQYAYYGKVGGCLITGNEDGIKHVR